MDAEVRSAVARALARHPRVIAAWIFGSVARGEATEDSDIDVAVLLDGELASGDELLAEIGSELEPFGPSGRADVLDFRAQGPVLRHRILSEGVLILDARPAVRIDVEGQSHSEYLDWKPTHDIAMRVSLTGLADRFARMARR
jgi:predicted nucleotidyltransferase